MDGSRPRRYRCLFAAAPVLVSLSLLAVSVEARTSRGPALPRDLLPVPMVRQHYSFDCGPAALKGLAAYWGAYEGSLRRLGRIINTRSNYGTLPQDLIRGARRLGLSASMKEHCTLRDLKRALARGEPVMVELQAWSEPHSRRIPWRERWDDGHYAVVVGMDKHNVYFMDPSVGDSKALEKTASYAWIPKKEFVERWHEWEREGTKTHHYCRPALFFSGKTPRSYELGTVLEGTKALKVSVRPPIRME